MGEPVTEAEIEAMADQIAREFDPVQVILFGSRARGEARAESDVDLLVVLEETANKRADAIAIRRAVSQFPWAKDIVVTTPEEIRRRGHLAGTVLRPALREGRTLYRRPRVAGNRDEALNWLRLAASDLALARLVVSSGEVALHHACYHAQQAAEKALKAGLTLIDIDPPKSHNLDSVRDTFPGGWAVQTAFPDLAELTEWNVQGRYPGDWPEARSEDAATMIGMAEAILASIVGDFERRGIAVPEPG